MFRKVTVRVLFAALIGVTVAGCVRGDRYVAQSHAVYTEALRQRLDEELLLNLVRLRYRDRPMFLQISSVIARFIRTGGFSLGASGGLDNSNTANDGVQMDALGNVGISGSFSEQPTVTFTPLQGEDFVARLMRPIDLDTMALLQRSGWRIDRVMRLTAQSINGLDNAASASGPTPTKAPGFRRFIEAVTALRQLQADRAVVVGTESSTRTLGGPLPVESVTAADVLAAATAGHRFEETEDGAAVVLRTTSTRFVVRVAAASAESGSTQQFRQILGLQPEGLSYDLQVAGGSVEDVLGEAGGRQRIVLVPRSLLGVLFFLCHSIDIPDAHAQQGLVTQTTTEAGEPFSWREVTDGLLHIRSSLERPEGAAISVPYRGYWFYIPDDDLDSKSTFNLLSQLFALQAGDPVSGGAPVPTLPL